LLPIYLRTDPPFQRSQNLTVYRHEWQRAGWAYWGSDSNQAMIEEFVAALRE
jgi:hypothetical protein